MKKLTGKQTEFMLGSLMGDAGIAKRGNSYRARFAQSSKQRLYLDWKRKIMNSWVNMKTLEFINKLNHKEFPACSFTTLSSVEFGNLYNLFYKDRVKVISNDVLRQLTPLSLAVWYLDDGTLSKDKKNGNVYYRAQFALGKVSIQEATLVKEFFKTLGIESWIIRGYNPEYKRCYPLIKLSLPGTRKFMSLIKKYIPDCMSYKTFIFPVTTTRRVS